MLEVSTQLRLHLARGLYLGGLRRFLRRVLMTGVRDHYQGAFRRGGCSVRAQEVRVQCQEVSQTRGLSFSGTRSISQGASSVRISQVTFPLEDMNNAVSNDSMRGC